MTNPVAQFDIRDAASTLAQKVNLEQLNDFVNEMIGSGAEQLLTIASDQVTPPARGAGVYKIETQSGAASDDLRNILLTNISEGRLLIVRPTNSSHVVTVKHGVGTSGEILLADGLDFAMSSSSWRLYLFLVGTSWVELFRTYGTDYKAQRDYFQIPYQVGSNILCPHKRLRVDYLSAATVQIQADEVLLTDVNGGQKRFTSINETLNVATTGANGRIASENGGTEKASDWYFGWLIGKADGTIDCVASLDCFPGGSSIHSVLPSGYTFAGLVTAAYNNGSSNFTDFWQRDDVYTQTGVTAVPTGTASTKTNVSLATSVPDCVSHVMFSAGLIPQSSGSAATAILSPDQASAIGELTLQSQPATTSTDIRYLEMDLRVPQAMAYRVNAGDSLDLVTLGFKW